MGTLLRRRRFGPLFATQFMGAFNDNLFKTAMLFLITYRLMGDDTAAAGTLVTAAAGVFILPFFLFSGIAGGLADARDKAAVARWVKRAEIVILGVGGLGLAIASVPLLFGVLFVMGTHSTVFGPVKYAILPQHLAPHELLAGTGLVEGGTFVAILLGQVAGGLLPTGWAAATMITVACAGALTSQAIPPAPPEHRTRIDWNPLTASAGVLRGAFAVRAVLLATIAISWFWALGTIYTAEFVPLVRGTLRASEPVATLFLVTFTVGIAAGSAGVSRLLGGHVSARAAPWAALAMAAASVDLVFALRGAASGGTGLVDVAGFVAAPGSWRVLADLFVLAVAGGVFSVPLYAILQTASGTGTRARAIAANNIVNAAFQVGAALTAGAAVGAGVAIPLVLAASGLSALLLIPLLRRL